MHSTLRSGARKGSVDMVAEDLATPTEAYVGPLFPRRNEFKELFFIRWGRLHFDVAWGVGLNLKVIVKVHHEDGTCEQYMVHTEPYEVRWNSHKRVTRDIFIHPNPARQGRVTCVKFSYILHHQFRSIPSRQEYLFMEGHELCHEGELHRRVNGHGMTPNHYRTAELDAGLLQRDIDWINQHPESLSLMPKFTKGQPWHPYHPKRYIHDQIDQVIRRRHETGAGPQSALKVCVDCIDDTDFINHLLFAHQCGVAVQCIVDWRKMTLTNSDNYLRLKRSGIELLGDVCTTRDPLAEVSSDMHNKFILFGEEDCIVGSFNITFDRWGANWESGMTFRSKGMVRLLDNIFQAIRGGVIQRYGIDPMSPFNLLYTFGRTALLSGKFYRPHHAIFSEIHRAKRSIDLCLFLIGDLRGEYGERISDALIQAQHRGVRVRIIFNGHLAWEGDPTRERSMTEELSRAPLPAVRRLKEGGIPLALAYGQHDRAIPYSPLHSKQCIIDEHTVLDGSFNWYNASVHSHDLMMVVRHPEVARHYLAEAQQILDTFRIVWL